MDIVGKQHRNTERIKKSLQDREARLLARAEMEKKRLARAVILQASARELVKEKIPDPVVQSKTQTQTQNSVSGIHVSQQIQEQPRVVAPTEADELVPTRTRNDDDLQELFDDVSTGYKDSGADFDQKHPGYRDFSAEDEFPGHESYFDLAERSSLQAYKRSLGVTQESTEESFVTTVTQAPDLSHEHVFEEDDVLEREDIQEKEQEKRAVREARSVRKSVSGLRSGLGALFLCGLVISLLVLTSLTLIDIGFWVFFFGLLIWRIDSRLSIAAALVCLIAIPVLLLGVRFGFVPGEVWAEAVAVWAYLFLVIGVVVQIWEYAVSSRAKTKLPGGMSNGQPHEV